jgi:hypothetical protein
VGANQSGEGVVVAACRYLDTTTSDIDWPLGLGSRHFAAASISKATKAIGGGVSESALVRVFADGSLIAEVLPELWLLSRYSVQLHAPFSEEHVRDLAVLVIDKESKGRKVDRIHELVDLKLLHLVRSRITVSKRRGHIFEAYMLDLSQYSGARAAWIEHRGVLEVEFRRYVEIGLAYLYSRQLITHSSAAGPQSIGGQIKRPVLVVPAFFV